MIMCFYIYSRTRNAPKTVQEEGNKEALLNDPEMSEAEEVKGNEHAGQEFVDNFIDELVKSRKEISTEYKGKE